MKSYLNLCGAAQKWPKLEWPPDHLVHLCVISVYLREDVDESTSMNASVRWTDLEYWLVGRGSATCISEVSCDLSSQSASHLTHVDYVIQSSVFPIGLAFQPCLCSLCELTALIGC